MNMQQYCSMEAGSIIIFQFLYTQISIQQLLNFCDIIQLMDFREFLKEGEGPIDCDEFKNIIRLLYTTLQQDDLETLISVYVPQKPNLTRQQCLYVREVVQSQKNKIDHHDPSLACFYLNNLLEAQNNTIVLKTISTIEDIDVNSEFIDILGQQFYRKLITYGSNGLLFEKIEDPPLKKYRFFQWIENDVDIAINEEGDGLYLQLLKHAWNFKFEAAKLVLDKIKIAFPNDDQVSSVEVGLKMFSEVYFTIVENQELKEVFIDRKEFSIRFQDEHINKMQESDFNSKISEVKQQLLFICNYFQFVKEGYKNKFYYAVAHFLCNREDNYVKESDEIVIIPQISITDRYFYARKFYRPQDLQVFKNQLLATSSKAWQIDYLILFGTHKESETILQNYIDETSDFQRAALISVYLKIFLQQSKIGLKDSKLAYYKRCIRNYQVLFTMANSVNKHKFDKKCITIQVERKKKTMTKTFHFNCVQCGNSQCLLSVIKRISNDAKRPQLQMKGNNYFGKDARSQIRYCVDCMFLLPKCCICLFPVTVFNGYAEQLKKNSSIGQKQKNCGESLYNSLVWCPKCFHGGHYSHIVSWMKRADYKRKKNCPVSSCLCECSL